MTPTQKRAFSKLTNEFQCAYTLQERIPTLNALVKMGFAEKYTDAIGSMFSPRTANKYRLSHKG